MEVCSHIAPEYFDHGEKCLETVCHNIERWPPPTPGRNISLPVLGRVFQVCQIAIFRNNLKSKLDLF